MATGPETGPGHYTEVDRLLDVVANESLDDGATFELIGRAIAHALQANTAAIAMSHVRVMDADYAAAWRTAISRHPTRSTL